MSIIPGISNQEYWSDPPQHTTTRSYANPISPPSNGCWVAYSSDDGDIYLFETELSALRFAVSNQTKYRVKFVVFGKPLLPMIDS